MDEDSSDTNYSGKSKQKKKSKYEDKDRKYWENKKHKPYGNTKKDFLFFIYLIAIIVWALIVIYLHPCVDVWGAIILGIPFLVFVLAIASLDGLSPSVEESMFKHNLLSTGLLIILPLLTFITRDFLGDHILMIQVVVLVITFSLLSMIDVWVPEKWFALTHHIRSIFQTFALTLILFSLYLYYSAMNDLPWCKLYKKPAN